MPSTWFAAGFNVNEGHQGQVSLRAGVWTKDFERHAIQAAMLDVRFFCFSVGFEVYRPKHRGDPSWVAIFGLTLWRWNRQWRREVRYLARYPLRWLCRLMPLRCEYTNPMLNVVPGDCARCGRTNPRFYEAYLPSYREILGMGGNSPVSAPPR